MSYFKDKKDIRVVKTQKAFQAAIGKLLERRKFKQITVNDLCEEALTSRAAFYTHYKDKYDLLESWFCCNLRELNKAGIENVVDSLIYQNPKVIQNILSNADDETNGIIVNGLVSSLLDMGIDLSLEERAAPEYFVLISFCAGGLFEMMNWQSEQKISSDFQNTQNYFFDFLNSILDFHNNYTTVGQNVKGGNKGIWTKTE